MTAKQATAAPAETTRNKILNPGLRRGDESEPTRQARQKSHRGEPIDPHRQWRSRAGSPFPFFAAERRPWPTGIVASLSEPAGRVSTRPAGRGRSEGTGVAGGAAGGASLVTFWSPQESNSPAGASPGQSPSIGGTRRTKQKGSKTLDPGVRRGDESKDTRHHRPPPRGCSSSEATGADRDTHSTQETACFTEMKLHVRIRSFSASEILTRMNRYPHGYLPP